MKTTTTPSNLASTFATEYSKFQMAADTCDGEAGLWGIQDAYSAGSPLYELAKKAERCWDEVSDYPQFDDPTIVQLIIDLDESV